MKNSPANIERSLQLMAGVANSFFDAIMAEGNNKLITGDFQLLLLDGIVVCNSSATRKDDEVVADIIIRPGVTCLVEEPFPVDEQEQKQSMSETLAYIAEEITPDLEAQPLFLQYNNACVIVSVDDEKQSVTYNVLRGHSFVHLEPLPTTVKRAQELDKAFKALLFSYLLEHYGNKRGFFR